MGVIGWWRRRSRPRCHLVKGCNQSGVLSALSMLVMEGRSAASPGILLTGPSHHFTCDKYLLLLLFLNFPAFLGCDLVVFCFFFHSLPLFIQEDFLTHSPEHLRVQIFGAR